MHPVDVGLVAAVFVLFVAVGVLIHLRRANGLVEGRPPKATIKRQLQTCQYKLATAEQNIFVWRDLAAKRKAIIDELTQELEHARR